MLKHAIKSMTVSLAEGLARTRPGAVFAKVLLQSGLGRSKSVTHGSIKLELHNPNSILTMRAETFSSKEPETLEWIDGFAKGSVLWDIGANVGLYSLYAAKARSCRVIAFEPSVFNLEWLARNIWKNELADHIQIVPVALADESGFQTMSFSTTEWGGANSHFGSEGTAPEHRRYEELKYQIMGLNPDSMVEQGMVSRPDHVKIDVDGIEHLILGGMPKVLKSVKSVLVEVDVAIPGQDETCKKHLKAAGLKLKDRNYTIGADTRTRQQSTAPQNQIWVRK